MVNVLIHILLFASIGLDPAPGNGTSGSSSNTTGGGTGGSGVGKARHIGACVIFKGGCGFPQILPILDACESHPHAPGLTPLALGIPVTRFVARNGILYFTYILPSNTSVLLNPLSVTLQAISGDPDLYVGVGFIPTVSTYSYRSTSSGSDAVSLIGGVLNRQVLYIGVYGYSSSSFDISVSLTVQT